MAREVIETFEAIINKKLFSIQRIDIEKLSPKKINPRNTKKNQNAKHLMKFADMFGYSSPAVKLKSIFLKTMQRDSLKNIILHFCRNIYHVEYKDPITFDGTWKEFTDDMKSLKVDKEGIFTLSFVTKILNIPNFKKSGRDMIFEREFVEGSIDADWLLKVERSLVESILKKDEKSKLYLGIKSEATEIRKNNLHFKNVYGEHPKKNLLLRDHMFKNIQKEDWRAMCLNEKADKWKDDDLRNAGPFIDSGRKDALVGIFPYHALVQLYSKLKQVRDEWSEQVDKLQKNPDMVLKNFIVNHPNGGKETAKIYFSRSKELERDEDYNDISKEILSSIKKLEETVSRKRLIENLKLVIYKMTEPQFFLITMLNRFNHNVKSEGMLWKTLNADLFNKDKTNPMWFSNAISSDDRIKMKYSDFENCVLQFSGKKYINGDALFKGVKYYSKDAEAIVIHYEEAFIRLIQSYGVPIGYKGHNTNGITTKKFDGRHEKEIRTLRSDEINEDLAMELIQEIENLPLLENSI